MRIELATGPQAFRLLSDPAFYKRWRALYEECSWSTPFQSPEFVSTWYCIYASQFTPVILLLMAGDSLDGLLTLARCPESGALFVAGCDRAEYQAWLARPAVSDSFMMGALAQLRAAFPGVTLRMHFLPPGIPVGWISTIDGGTASAVSKRGGRR